MSLYNGRRKFAGHDQTSVASLEVNGIHYRCNVFLNVAEWSIDAVCRRVFPDGSTSIVFQNSVRVASPSAVLDVVIPLDCPRILAWGNTFVVHYLYATRTVTLGEDTIADYALYRATMDMEAFSPTTWTDRSSTPIYGDGLYDAKASGAGDDFDFVVARRTSETDIVVTRYRGPTWNLVDRVWSTTVTETIDSRVLALHAHEGDDAVFLAYQITGSQNLSTRRLVYSSGVAAGAAVTCFAGPNAQSVFVSAGFCRADETNTVVVADMIEDNGHLVRFLHALYFRSITTANGATATQLRKAYHLELKSHPWTWASGSNSNGSDPSVYVVVSFRSVVDPYEWDQSFQYVVNLDYHLWGVSTSNTELRPRIVSTIASLGIPDGRSAGWAPNGSTFNSLVHLNGPSRRMNHLSEVAPGPSLGSDCKTKAIATVVWASSAYEVQHEQETDNDVYAKTVQHASVFNLISYMEEPWTMHFEPSLVEQPVTNFAQANPRPMCMPVEIARATILGGGTLHTYDGQQVVELGFPWRPEIFEAEPIDSGSFPGEDHDLVPTEVYHAYAVYEWRDNAGQLHRSPPSNVATCTLGAGDDAIVWRVRTMTASQKDAILHFAKANSISIRIFRDTPASAAFYNLFSAGTFDSLTPYREIDTPINVATAPYIDVYDGRADARILNANNLAPYQYGETAGVFDPEVPIVIPAMSVITEWEGRLWGADALDPAVIYYSDQILPDLGAAGQFYLAPQFLPSGFFRIGEIGEVTAMIGMFNSLIIFTATSIRALSIVADVGGGLLQIQSQILHESTGCVEPRSVVLAPEGVFFQSAKGYYLLDRGMSLDYLSGGSAVEDLIREAGTVRSATLLKDRTEIRLVCNGTPTPQQTVVLSFEEFSGADDLSITFVEQGVTVTVPAEDAGDAETALDSFVEQLEELDFIDSAEGFPEGLSLSITFTAGVSEQTLTFPSGPISLAGSTTVSAAAHPRVLVCNYLFRRWTTAELVQPSTSARLSELVDGAAWGGNGETDAHVALAQGALLIQRAPSDPLAYTDQTALGTSVGIPIDLLLAWFHAAGISGFQRIWEVAVQTSKPHASEFSIDLDYVLDGDYDNPVNETNLAVTSVSPARVRVRPSIQKCHAIRVRIYENTGVQNEENIRVTSVTYKVGVKRGPGRVSDTQIAS